MSHTYTPDAHRSIGNRNIPQLLVESTTRLIYLRLYDNRGDSSKSTPSPSSLYYSLTHTHRSIGYRNIPQPLSDSTVRLIHLRVYDSRASSSIHTPSPLSLWFTHGHRSIGYFNIPHPLTESDVRLICRLGNINIGIKSPKPNSSEEPPNKERIETNEFRRSRKHWSNGFGARSLFRTPERRTDEQEKKTIEVTEGTALEGVMTAKDARDLGILNVSRLMLLKE